MKTSNLAKTCSELANVPFRTVMGGVIAPLQASKLVTLGSRGKHGGGEMTSADRINAFLGCVLDHPRGVPLGESVRRVRQLEMHAARQTHVLGASTEQDIRGAFGLIAGLSIGPLDRLGTVLEHLLDDMRSGTLQRWAAGAAVSITLEFSRGATAAMLVLDKGAQGAFFAFAPDDEHRPHESGVDRIIRVHTKAFERLAKDAT